jgi:hypothetical protein
VSYSLLPADAPLWKEPKPLGLAWLERQVFQNQFPVLSDRGFHAVCFHDLSVEHPNHMIPTTTILNIRTHYRSQKSPAKIFLVLNKPTSNPEVTH